MGQAPVLYSFRRCPYAIRARLALAAAGIAVELREVKLSAKPPELLEASRKGTVPVLVEGGRVIDESLAIMEWALGRHDPFAWLSAEPSAVEALIATNDGPFKEHLDRFRYPHRYAQGDPHGHRVEALAILRSWNDQLEAGHGGWLLGKRATLADWALLPFVRQFRIADPEGFDAEPGLEALLGWLDRYTKGTELAAVMAPPWASRHIWRSRHWLYHLALRDEWRSSSVDGEYRRSTRGRSLEDVGYVHASLLHQLEDTYRRFYGDGQEVVVLTIDPLGLAAKGIAVRMEAAGEGLEHFPHIYGPIPRAAVLEAEPWPGEGSL